MPSRQKSDPSLDQLHLLPPGSFYVTVNGRKVPDWETLLKDGENDGSGPEVNYQVHIRVLGGKGGFGSLLKSFRFHKSTNTDMCRDLSGRRMRDVKEEEKLKKWIAKKAEREAEKERLKQLKYEKLKAGPAKHEFNDPKFRQQGEEILETTEDALEFGLKNKQMKDAEDPDQPGCSSSTSSEATTLKRKTHSPPSHGGENGGKSGGETVAKKIKIDPSDPWLDLDPDDLSDSDDEDENADEPAKDVTGDQQGVGEQQQPMDETVKSWTFHKTAAGEEEDNPSQEEEKDDNKQNVSDYDNVEKESTNKSTAEKEPNADKSQEAGTNEESDKSTTGNNNNQKSVYVMPDEPTPMKHRNKLLRMLTGQKTSSSYSVAATNSAPAGDGGQSSLVTPSEPPPTAPKETPKKENKKNQVKEGSADSSKYDPITLEPLISVDSLLGFEADHLKAELIRRRLKCGGTLEERAKRLWSVRGLQPEEYPKKIMAK